MLTSGFLRSTQRNNLVSLNSFGPGRDFSQAISLRRLEAYIDQTCPECLKRSINVRSFCIRDTYAHMTKSDVLSGNIYMIVRSAFLLTDKKSTKYVFRADTAKTCR